MIWWWSAASCPTARWAAVEDPDSPSRQWWCKPCGQAPRWKTRSSSRRPPGAQAPGDAEPGLLQELHDAGVVTIFVYSGTPRPPPGCRTSGTRCARRCGHRPHAATGNPGAILQRRVRATFGIVYGFTADGFTRRELRDYVDDVRQQLLSCEHLEDRRHRAQDERMMSSSRPNGWRPRTRSRRAGRCPAGAERRQPHRTVQTDQRRSSAASRGRSRASRTSSRSTSP